VPSDNQHQTHEQRLAASEILLPAPLPAFGQYVPYVLSGTTLWVSGHFGTTPEVALLTGKVGGDVDLETARHAARSAACNLLATVRDALGTLDRVVQVLSVYGVVNATPDFTDHTRVIDAGSDVLVAVFGEAGRHARLAIGVSSLPANMVLEMQAILAVEPAVTK
jgi:enamine deaminase RidA (YjgF/YER057c/UK114 family)